MLINTTARSRVESGGFIRITVIADSRAPRRYPPTALNAAAPANHYRLLLAR